MPERTIAFIHNPQTSKPELDFMAGSGLPDNNHFQNVVNRVDSVLGFGEGLNPKRQISPVTFSLAAFQAFETGLGEYLHPGGLREAPDYKKWISGHSIGENGALVQAGIMGLEDMSWALMVRELVTTQKWRELLKIVGNDIGAVSKFEELKSSVLSGLKGLLSVRGVNSADVEATLANAKQYLGESVSIFLANRNAPEHTVIAFRSKVEDANHVLNNVGNLFSGYKNAKITLLPTSSANHSPLLVPEEAIFGFVLARHNMRARVKDLPEDTNIRLFSPMANRYLRNADDGYNLLTHQLTWGVGFIDAMAELSARDDIGIILTADPVNGVPSMVQKNKVNGRIRVNLINKDSIDEGIQKVGDYLRQ